MRVLIGKGASVAAPASGCMSAPKPVGAVVDELLSESVAEVTKVEE